METRAKMMSRAGTLPYGRGSVGLFQNRDRKEALEPPMAAQGGKVVAQVLDFRCDHSEGGKVVAQVLDFRCDHSEALIIAED